MHHNALISISLTLGLVGFGSTLPLGGLFSRSPQAIGPDQVDGTFQSLLDTVNATQFSSAELYKRVRARQDDFEVDEINHNGNGSNIIAVTFPDDADGPGVTINIEAAFDSDRPVGYYQFINGAEKSDASFGDIITDIGGASARVVTTHVKNAILHFEDGYLDLFSSDMFECDFTGPTRAILANNDPGHLTVGIAHTVAAVGAGVGFTYAMKAPNITLTESLIVAGSSAGVGVAIGRIFDALQRNGFLNRSDAIITACFVTSAEAFITAAKNIYKGLSGGDQCYSEGDLQHASAALADIVSVPDGLPLTSFQEAIGIAASHPSSSGVD